MMTNFFDDINNWTILSWNVAEIMVKQNPNLNYSLFDGGPPARTAYILLHRYPKPWMEETISSFISVVIDHIKKNKELTLLYDHL